MAFPQGFRLTATALIHLQTAGFPPTIAPGFIGAIVYRLFFDPQAGAQRIMLAVEGIQRRFQAGSYVWMAVIAVDPFGRIRLQIKKFVGAGRIAKDEFPAVGAYHPQIAIIFLIYPPLFAQFHAITAPKWGNSIKLLY